MAKQFFYYENKNAKINSEIKLSDELIFWKKHSYLRFQMMKDARQQNGRENKWDQWQRQYEAWRPPKNNDDWQSTIVPPYTTSVVESALSELVDQTLRPRITARKREYVPHATVMNYIYDYTWELGNGDIELYKSLKQGLILGTTIWQDYYYQDKRMVQQIVEYDKKTGQEKYKDVELMDYDDVYGETVSLWDVWFDPDARSVNTGPYKAQDAIRRYIMHVDTFRNTFKGTKYDKYGYVDKIRPGGDTNYYQYYQPPQGIDHSNYVELLWHWIRVPDKLVLLANDVPFYLGPNPYNHKQLPFSVGYDTMDPFSIYGKGEPELLESIQDELTTIRRMRLDRQKMDIFKMIFVGANETVTDQDLIPAPMKPIEVQDVNNIKAFEYGDINPSAYREEQLLKEDGTRVTGIDDRFQSVQGRGATATESAILKEASTKRLRTKIWINSRTLLMDQMRLRVPNILQYYKTPKVMEITGKNAIEKMMKIREVSMEGRLYKSGERFYEKEYRTIVTKNKELKKKDTGGVEVLDKRGDNFFMVTPDLLAPSSAFFHYKLQAEPYFPLSKPLLQQRVDTLFNNPVIQAAVQMGHYSIPKMADQIMEINDFEPDQFYEADQDQQKGDLLSDPTMMLEQASKENEIMMSGETLIGTPYATPEHTRVHLEFMQSNTFKSKADQNIISNFTGHILEEWTAQMARYQGAGNIPGQPGMGGAPGGQELPVRQKEMNGIMGGEMKAANPNRIVGPEAVPDMTGMMSR